MPNESSVSTRFQPGAAWRGNAAGRPPGHAGESLSAYVRELGGPDGKLYVDKLHALAVGEHRDAKVRLRAIEVLLDRGWGRSIERLNVSGSFAALDPSKIARLTDEELAQATALVEKLAADDAA